jgi:hypothetical protein
VPEPSSCEVKIAIEKLIGYSYRSDSDHIPGELIPAGGITTRSEISRLVNSILSKEDTGVTGLITLVGWGKIDHAY